MIDLNQAAVISSAIDRGWRPDPEVLRGVTVADALNQGDPYGRYWTVDQPRSLAQAEEDGPALAIAADAATTFLNSQPAN